MYVCIVFLSRYIVCTYSCGFSWFYWDWYKDKETVTQHILGNENNYGGYAPKCLYVKRKYKNYKAEIWEHFNNLSIPIDEYNNAWTKAEEYMSTKKVRT